MSTRKDNPAVGPVEFPVSADDPLCESHALISSMLAECKTTWNHYSFDFSKSNSWATIQKKSRSEKVQLLDAALKRVKWAEQNEQAANERAEADEADSDEHVVDFRASGILCLRLVAQLLRQKLPIEQPLLLDLLHWGAEGWSVSYYSPHGGVVKALENFSKDHEPTAAVIDAANAFRARLQNQGEFSEFRKSVERIDKALGVEQQLNLQPGEAWSDVALADLDAMPAKRKSAWQDLLHQCQQADGGSPKKKWLTATQPLLAAIPLEEFTAIRHPLVSAGRQTAHRKCPHLRVFPDGNLMIIEPHADMLKGLVWCAGQFESVDLSRAITALAISAYRKVPGIGPRAVKIGNACVYALGSMPGMEGVSQLALLKVRVKFGTAQKGIQKALLATAERGGHSA